MKDQLRSMTGFAEASAQDGGRRVAVSVRAVNHRFFDLRVHLPEGLEALEMAVREKVREAVRRGHVDVYVRVQFAGAPEVKVNRQAAELYLKAIRELQSEFDVRGEADLGTILRLPGVVEVAAPVEASEAERVGEVLGRTLEEALVRLNQMRRAEGSRLGEEMSRVTGRIDETVGKMEQLAEVARKAYAERLRERVRELLDQSALDPGRLAQEVAQVAARSDTAEEMTRLRSHVVEFRHVLEGLTEAGKKLDFLCQEMQREVNTTLAKTPALGPDGLEITRQGLAAKAEVEKLREQVQNIE